MASISDAVSQMVTRSSSKSTKLPPSTVILLTLEAFNKTMAEFRKTQEKISAQCKLFFESHNTKFDELKKSIDLLTIQVVDLKTENESLRNNITDIYEACTNS